MRFKCPHCQRHVDAGPEYAGRTVNCPHENCGKPFLIPQEALAHESAIQRPQPSQTTSMFDLRRLRLPRNTTEFDQRIQLPNGVPTITDHRGIEHIAEQLGASPFFSANANGALAIVCHDLLPDSTKSAEEAVRASRVICIPVFANFPEYPILCLKCAIYDTPRLDRSLFKAGILFVSQGPLLFERIVDITSGHIQLFLESLLLNDTGNFSLCSGPSPSTQCAAICQFSYRMPPASMRPQAIARSFSFPNQPFPYRSTQDDRQALWDALVEAANHFNAIPETQRDFDKAWEAYFRKSIGRQRTD